jgi:hypothetical protein
MHCADRKCCSTALACPHNGSGCSSSLACQILGELSVLDGELSCRTELSAHQQRPCVESRKGLRGIPLLLLLCVLGCACHISVSGDFDQLSATLSRERGHAPPSPTATVPPVHGLMLRSSCLVIATAGVHASKAESQLQSSDKIEKSCAQASLLPLVRRLSPTRDEASGDGCTGGRPTEHSLKRFLRCCETSEAVRQGECAQEHASTTSFSVDPGCRSASVRFKAVEWRVDVDLCMCVGWEGSQ